MSATRPWPDHLRDFCFFFFTFSHILLRNQTGRQNEIMKAVYLIVADGALSAWFHGACQIRLGAK